MKEIPTEKEIRGLLEKFPYRPPNENTPLMEQLLKLARDRHYWFVEIKPKLGAFLEDLNNIKVEVAEGDTPNIFVFQGKQLITKFWVYPDGTINYRKFLPTTTKEIELVKLDSVSRAQIQKHYNDLREINTVFLDDLKVIIDEIDRGVYSKPQEVFDRIFELIKINIKENEECLGAVLQK